MGLFKKTNRKPEPAGYADTMTSEDMAALIVDALIFARVVNEADRKVAEEVVC
jgi:hypothetical protein